MDHTEFGYSLQNLMFLNSVQNHILRLSPPKKFQKIVSVHWQELLNAVTWIYVCQEKSVYFGEKTVVLLEGLSDFVYTVLQICDRQTDRQF